MDIFRIARLAHEVNRGYCASLGDYSQPAWEDAPEWQRQSAIHGVEFHLKAIAEGRDLKPSDSHDAWLKEKAEQGWKFGLVKDADKKEHPCFVPYDQLPQEQRSKDFIFGAVIRAVASDASVLA